jgi:hypothetical protein
MRDNIILRIGITFGNTASLSALRSPIVCYPRLLIQHFRSYPLHLEVIPYMHNLKTGHDVVTRHKLLRL